MLPRDAEIIASYSNPSYVLGWTPTMAPLVLTHPAGMTATAGQNVTLSAQFAATPSPSLQWSRNGTAIPGATGSTLNLGNVRGGDAGSYTVTATNASGRVTSNPAVVTVR
jgi:uncharacterized protein YjdB